MKMLSDSEGSVSGDEDLRINTKYAQRFEKQKRFQDLQRAKELLGDESEEGSESSSESEDEDAEALTTAVDLQVEI